MTFLQLVQRTARECRVNTSSLTSVLNQTGDRQRIVDWVADAWFDIQAAHQDWKFLRATATWATVASQAQYTTLQCGITASTFGKWIPESFRNYLSSGSSMAWGDDAWGDSPYDGSTAGGGYATEIFMDEMPYASWRDLWLFGANRSVTSRPLYFAINPADGIALGPAPLAGYTILGDYYTSPVRMAADDDQHTLPTKHNDMIIVYKAMMSYGEHWSAAEVYGRGERGYKRHLASLEIDQLPAMTFCGALS